MDFKQISEKEDGKVKTIVSAASLDEGCIVQVSVKQGHSSENSICYCPIDLNAKPEVKKTVSRKK